MIMKCPDCGRRFVIHWEDYKEMIKGVKLTPNQAGEDERVKYDLAELIADSDSLSSLGKAEAILKEYTLVKKNPSTEER